MSASQLYGSPKIIPNDCCAKSVHPLPWQGRIFVPQFVAVFQSSNVRPMEQTKFTTYLRPETGIKPVGKVSLLSTSMPNLVVLRQTVMLHERGHKFIPSPLGLQNRGLKTVNSPCWLTVPHLVALSQTA